MLRAFVITGALAGALLAGACRDAQLERLAAIRDEICACKTPECGQQALKRVPQQDVKANRPAQQLAKQMMDCLSELYLADRPSTDPDAEQPAEPAASGAAPASSGAATGP